MSLFDTPPEATPQSFNELVGEGKKYRDEDAVAKALAEKDRFIAQLQNETAEARRLVTQQERSQEILDRLEALRTTPTAEHQPAPQVVERVEHTGITTDDVEKLLAEREARAKRTANIEKVKAELVDIYGSNFGGALKSLAESMGVTPDYLENVAAQSPQAFMRLVAPSSQGPSAFTPPVSNGQPQSGFIPTAGPNQKRSFYKKLLESDKAKYFSPAVQNRMYKDALVLKEDFWDVAG